MDYIQEIGTKAQAAKLPISKLSSDKKNEVLQKVADALVARAEFILEENKADADEWTRKGKDEGMLDRLLLSEDRIEGMAVGLRQLVALEDPVGEVLYMKMNTGILRDVYADKYGFNITDLTVAAMIKAYLQSMKVEVVPEVSEETVE